MSKSFLELPIDVYVDLKDSTRYIAMIRGFDWVFRASTPMMANKRADDFRKEEWNKISKKADRVPVSKPKAKPSTAAAPPDTEEEEIEP